MDKNTDDFNDINVLINDWERHQDNFASWHDLISESTTLDEKCVGEVADFLHTLYKRINEHNVAEAEGMVNFISINLFVISKIKDFSKIIFTKEPIGEVKYISTQVTREQIGELGFMGLTMENIIQNLQCHLTEDLINYINNRIDEGHLVRVNNFAESITMISDGTDLPRLTLKTRIEFINYKDHKDVIRN
jgi:hypothetical protein